MSDEQNMNNEKKCDKKLFTILLAISVILSALSFGLSVYNTVISTQGAVQSGQHGKVLISKKYDKGQSLEKAYKTQKPIVVFFYADWCGFCQRFAPTFHAIAKDKQIRKNFAIAYVNCDKPENREYMEQFNVHGFPTVYVIKDQDNKVQLENHTFFNADSKDVVKANILKVIEEK